MSVITRQIWITRRMRIQPIELVQGSQVAIELQLMDYEIPRGASVKAYAKGKRAKAIYVSGCTASGNTVSIVPESGFFVPGGNSLQIEINSKIIPFSIDVICEPRVSAGGGASTPEAILPLVERAEAAAQEAAAYAQILSEGGGQGAAASQTKVYCWGDSLTEGVGGNVKQAEGIFIYPEYSYPKTLAESYNVVNCGARGENIPSIMARQGADPIVVGGFTIPADRTPVKIGELNLSSGAGLKTRSGATAQILKESEGSGINPCTISGVKGTLYRQLENHFDAEHTYGYFFIRKLPGDAVAVPENTEVVTHAMQNFRNGIAVIWMGANGGYSSHSDYINKLNTMIQYGNYTNYLIILSREFVEPWRAEIKNAFTDEDGFCHVIDLLEELPARGYMLAGLCFNSPDTSSWSTTDVIKKKVPLLCEYITGQTGENAYGALHYSAWGYKAIGKLVREKLDAMNISQGTSSSGGNTPGGDTPAPEENYSGEDEYGAYLYKLPAAKTLRGASVIDTKIKLYDDKDKNWTVVCVFDGIATSAEGWPAQILACNYDGSPGLYARYASEEDGLFVGAGTGGVNSNYATGWENHNRNGLNVLIAVKSGGNYSLFLNGGLAYGAPLGYGITAEQQHELTLIAGARYSAEGAKQYYTSVTIKQLIVYYEALANSAVEEMTQTFLSET